MNPGAKRLLEQRQEAEAELVGLGHGAVLSSMVEAIMARVAAYLFKKAGPDHDCPCAVCKLLTPHKDRYDAFEARVDQEHRARHPDRRIP